VKTKVNSGIEILPLVHLTEKTFTIKEMVKIIGILLISWFLLACNGSNKVTVKTTSIFKSEQLQILQITQNAFQHISYKQTNDFGNVPCNGLIIKDGNEALIFDTPTNDNAALELINWVQNNLKCKIVAVVPTHFHDDCLGGLKIFKEKNIDSYGNTATVELATKNNLEAPAIAFNDSIILKLGSTTIFLKHFGEGHTRDNIVGYFPTDNVLFGGCLIKEMGASKGYLGDANINAWSNTVTAIKVAYPKVQIVVPGHGKAGNAQLLDYTIKLFALGK
jgi:metallo-beta-lactamase class B